MSTRLPLLSVGALPFLTLLITGCASAHAAPQQDALADVYTAVALTISGASATAAPSATPTIAASPAVLPLTASPYPTATATSGVAYTYSSGCNNAAYVSDVTVADGEEMAPGESFTKTWELLNTGSCAWSPSYSIVFVSGSEMDASSASLDAVVAVGVHGDVSVELIAPEDEGAYTGYWRLADASGSLFGERVYVQIVVSADAATLTSTPTSTSETLTPTPTATEDVPTSATALTAIIESTPTATPGGITSSPTEINHYEKQIKT